MTAPPKTQWGDHPFTGLDIAGQQDQPAPKTQWGGRPFYPLGEGPPSPTATARKGNAKGTSGRTTAPFAPNQFISFYGEVYTNPSENRSFQVLAGDAPPMIVGGYAKWQVIDRPLNVGLTVFQGYDPITMTIPVRFTTNDNYGWHDDNAAGENVEADIEMLEWMAGLLPTDHSYKPAGTGAPIVYVNTYDGNGHTIPLIPFDLQNSPGSPTVPSNLVKTTTRGWFVQSLAWDANPDRNASGYRLRQDAVVGLIAAKLATNSDSAAARAAALKAEKGKTTVFISRPGADTALKIAAKLGARSAPGLAKAIITDPGNKKLHLRYPGAPIRDHTKVRIPSYYVG